MNISLLHVRWNEIESQIYDEIHEKGFSMAISNFLTQQYIQQITLISAENQN